MNEDEELQEQDAERTPGWIKLYRQILESSFWLEDMPYDLRSAFIHVLCSANWSPAIFHPRNSHVITIKRGQLFTSTRKLMSTFHRSSEWVRNWYKTMEDHGMLTVEPHTTGTLLTIVNYGKYQDVENTERTLTNTLREHKVTRTENTDRIRYKKNKEDKEGEEEKRNPAPPEPPTEESREEDDDEGMTPEEARRYWESLTQPKMTSGE